MGGNLMIFLLFGLYASTAHEEKQSHPRFFSEFNRCIVQNKTRLCVATVVGPTTGVFLASFYGLANCGLNSAPNQCENMHLDILLAITTGMTLGLCVKLLIIYHNMCGQCRSVWHENAKKDWLLKYAL